MTHEATDDNGADAYYEDWLAACREGKNLASNGERVTVTLALRIAADVLRSMDPNVSSHQMWTPNDLRLARGAIAGLRAQQGVEEYAGGPEIMLTHFCDIAIYG